MLAVDGAVCSAVQCSVALQRSSCLRLCPVQAERELMKQSLLTIMNEVVSRFLTITLGFL